LHVPFLYLQPGQNVTVATKTNEFIRKYVDDPLLDKFLWAALDNAPAPPCPPLTECPAGHAKPVRISPSSRRVNLV